MKVAVYAGTRNIYSDMVPAAKSLLIHSDVDKIYFLIEDDEFPYELPPEIECINVSNQTYFDPNGPNYKSKWTYMVLIRAALSKVFPQYDTILSLDVDTIVNENINDIWNYNLDGYYLAAAKELQLSTDTFTYINMGVALLNLKQLREDKKDDEIIHAINTKYYEFNEQDCINELCQGHILELPPDYNICYYTGKPAHRKIIHFAATKIWRELAIVEKYRNIPIVRNIPDKYGLDIIIPSYKNLKALEKTLKSVYDDYMFKLTNAYNFPIQITVVDDNSQIDYQAIQKKFPKVNFIFKEVNEGPGMARQTGMNNTNNPYILFVDSGDYILSKYALLQIILTILSNTIPYLYCWRWLDEFNHTYNEDNSGFLHGVVYKREFLEIHGITFCKESSYANEDIGFNHTCNLIIKQLQHYNDSIKYQTYETPIYMYTYDKQSITHKNKGEFIYLPQLKGITTNIEHAVKIAHNNHVKKDIIWEDVSHIMVRVYYDFYNIMKNKPEQGQMAWDIARKYYFNVFKPYQITDNTIINAAMGRYIPQLQKLKVKRINFNRFLKDLETTEIIPELYFDFC